MSYPKRCEKCDQFGAWCFCVSPVEPDLGTVWFGFDASVQRYTARYLMHVIYLDTSDKAVQVKSRLQETNKLKTNEYGEFGIPYTNHNWNELLNVGVVI